MIELRGHRFGDRGWFTKTAIEGEFVAVPVSEYQLRLPDDPTDGDGVFLEYVTLCRDGAPLALVRMDANPYRSVAAAAMQLNTADVTEAELCECVSLVLLHLADVRSMEYVIAYCSHAPESRSRAALERFGFERLGEIPEHVYAHGKLQPREVWGRALRGGAR
jgi:hypothetical protein